MDLVLACTWGGGQELWEREVTGGPPYLPLKKECRSPDPTQREGSTGCWREDAGWSSSSLEPQDPVCPPSHGRVCVEAW